MTALGPFPVTASADEVAAFRAATGLPPGDAVPATFPMRWLAAREVREALLAMAPEADIVPVHESQTFDYLAALDFGRSYEMRIEGRRDAAPDRLVLTGEVATTDGRVVVAFETILRLFSTAAAAA